MYRFGECEIDAAVRELRRRGELVHLEPQAFDLLVLLIDQRDRVVSKAELLDGVWGHQFVSEANLTTRVKEARRAVGDDGTRQGLIRNVRGRGYRFVGILDDASANTSTDAPMTSELIGRNDELQAIVDLVRRGTLVTIVGPGGVGKSALARAVATSLAAGYADGEHVVELAPMEDGADLAVAVARALDVVLDRDRPDDAIRAMARLPALLVLDNCEHVVDDVATLVAHLVATADANVRILATSQVRLGLSAETVVPVGPLSVADSTVLFVERARAVAPAFDVEAIGRERVEQLVSVLDRLPLTIEMAAARLGSMAFDELAHAIDEGSALLKMTHRAPAHRHRSLGSVVEWSTSLLEPTQRELFSAFSVFAGRVTASDAGSVLAPDDPRGALFELGALAERSLLVAHVDGPETSYSMLTTVRAVASKWLDETDQADVVRRRHAEHIAGVLRSIDDQLRTPDEPRARQRLATIVDEVRVAFRWARDHDALLASDMSASLFHAAHSTLWHEPAEWARELLDAHPASAPNSLWGARLMVAGVAVHRGELESAHEHASAAERVTSGRLRGIALELLADIALNQGALDSAISTANEMRQLGDELGDPHFSAFAASDLAMAYTHKGDATRALRELGDGLGELAPTDAAWIACTRGLAWMGRDAHLAIEALVEAIELGELVGNRYVIGVARSFLAVEYARIGETGPALDAFADAFSDFQRHGNRTDATFLMPWLMGWLEGIGEDRRVALIGAQMGTDLDAAIELALEVIEDRRGG